MEDHHSEWGRDFPYYKNIIQQKLGDSLMFQFYLN